MDNNNSIFFIILGNKNLKVLRSGRGERSNYLLEELELRHRQHLHREREAF